VSRSRLRGPRRGLPALTMQAALLFLVSILPVLLVGGWLNYAYARAGLEQQIRVDTTDRTRDVQQALSAVLVRELERLQALAAVQSLGHPAGPGAPSADRARTQQAYEHAAPDGAIRVSYVENPVGRVLRAYREQYPHRAVVLLADPQGQLESVTTPAWPYFDLAAQPWWPDLVHQPAEDALRIARPLAVPGFGLLLFLSVPVLDTDGLPVGVLTVGLTFADVVEPILSQLQRTGTTTLLASGDGSILLALPHWPGPQLPAELAPTLRAVGPGALPYASYLVTYAPLQLARGTGLDDVHSLIALNQLNWIVFLLTPNDMAFAPLQQQLIILTTGTIATAIVVVLVAVIAVRWLVTWPLDRLEVVIADVRQHGLDPARITGVHTRLPRGRNEIGRLSQTFAQMLQELTELTRAQAQAEETLRASETRLALQYATTKLLVESATLDQAMPALLQTIGERLGWEIGAFWSLDAAAGLLCCRTLWIAPQIPRADLELIRPQLATAPGAGLAGHVWAHGEPGWRAAIAAQDGLPELLRGAVGGQGGAIGVPIRTGSLVHGVLGFFGRDLPPPGADLARTLGTIGAQIGQFIERTAAEQALQHQAHHDALTNLPNRLLLHDRLQQALLAAQRDRTTLALLLLDLDRFKEVNDTFGHAHGDQLLQQVSTRLRSTLRASDTIARLGGDEFAVLLPHADQGGAAVAARMLLAALDEPCQVEGVPLQVSGSIGVALYPAHGTDAEVLLQRADVAMYVAKRGHSGYAVYALDQDEYSPSRLSLIGALHHAITHDELLLYYQPKIDLRTGQVQEVEALVRWPHPEQGFIAADQVVALAEQAGLMTSLTLWVLKTALRQAEIWQRANLTLCVAVNLSMWDLHDPELPATITALLASYGVPPAALRLELTESTLMTNAARTLEILTRLAALGVGLSIDDFGTGYSSLAYLKRLPVNELKIDRSFVSDMIVDETDAAIVRSTISLGQSLGLRVVTEGVEDQATWDQLVALGCDMVQGYFLSPPLPAAELVCWLQALRRAVA